jgi:peptide/nickel transport system permease protein
MMQLGRWKRWLLALLVIHGIIACAGFFAPYDPAEQDRERSYLPPMKIHLVDTEGHFHFRPFFYSEQLRGGSFDQFEERTEQAIPLRFFVTGARYHLLGILQSRTHFFGAEARRVYLLGSDAYGRDQLSRILYGGQISLLAGLLGAGLTLLIGVLIGATAGY